MSMISPSSRLPFRTIVLGAAITALCAGGAGVTARAHRPRPRPTSEASRRPIKPSLPISRQRAGERTLRQSAPQL